MKARLERTFDKLVNHYTPALGSQAHGSDRLRMLADGLAREGILVIAGRVPSHVTAQQVINDWVAAYYDLHQLLTGELFPNHTGLRVTDADEQLPPIFVLASDVCAVAKILGAYVVPFVAGQQRQGRYYRAHLKGIMHDIIHDLEGGDLSGAQVDHLAQQGVPMLQRLLTSVVQQEALTSPHESIMQHIPVMPPTLPEDKPANRPARVTQNGSASPADTPPASAQNGKSRSPDITDEPPRDMTDTGDMFVPIFFKRPKKQ